MIGENSLLRFADEEIGRLKDRLAEVKRERDAAEILLLDVWQHNVSRGAVPLTADLFNRIADLARAVRERSG